MRALLHLTAPYLAGFVGLSVLAAAIVLAFDVYATPGFALGATLLKLCGL